VAIGTMLPERGLGFVVDPLGGRFVGNASRLSKPGLAFDLDVDPPDARSLVEGHVLHSCAFL
jgi:hypothetical protein